MRATARSEAVSREALAARSREWQFGRTLPERIAAYWASQMLDGSLTRWSDFPDRETMARFHVKSRRTLLAAKHLLADTGCAARTTRGWVTAGHSDVPKTVMGGHAARTHWAGDLPCPARERHEVVAPRPIAKTPCVRGVSRLVGESAR